MRNLDYNEYLICKMCGDLFQMSVERSNLSSPQFIRRFMTNRDINYQFYSKTYLLISTSREQIIDEMNEMFEPSKNKYTYSIDEMYWIGYIYSCLAFLYEIPYKKVYELFNAREIRKYYPIYHTFGIEQAAERMMENIGYEKVDIQKRALELMRELIKQERLEKKAK